jgi:Tfp pilus assembly protein PilX
MKAGTMVKSMSRMARDEKGMASILVTMIMMIVITLIVLGFAQVTRQNQREALDDQLSTEAYYAAESGVNAAVKFLTTGSNSALSIDTVGQGQCQTFINDQPTDEVPGLGGGGVNVLNATTKTQYTCLMVDTTPSSLKVSPLTQASATVLHLKSSSGNPFKTLEFQWNEETNSPFSVPGLNKCYSSGSTAILPAYGSWNCPFGILRLDLVNASTGDVSNATFESNQYVSSFYMIPTYSADSPNLTVNPPLQKAFVQCTSGGSCALTLNMPGNSAEYYARLSMIYQDSSDVTITATDTTSKSVNFTGGQALIDSTGQAQDELRRVQVRIPLVTAAGTPPLYGLQTTDSICKQLTDGPTIATTDNCSSDL